MVPGGLRGGREGAAAAPLAAEAARIARRRAAAAAAGGRSEGDTVPPAATLSSPPPGPCRYPWGCPPRLSPQCRPLLTPTCSETTKSPERTRSPGVGRLGPSAGAGKVEAAGPGVRQRRGQPQRRGGGERRRPRGGNARAGDGVEAPRAHVTGGAGRQARACAGLGATGRGCTPAGHVRLCNSLSPPWFAHPAEPIPSLGRRQLSTSSFTPSVCCVRF